jgi:hypothetical protein
MDSPCHTDFWFWNGQMVFGNGVTAWKGKDSLESRVIGTGVAGYPHYCRQWAWTRNKRAWIAQFVQVRSTSA